YRTIIVTKGHHGDQMAKVHRSGLLPLLHGVVVAPTKKPHEYLGVLQQFNLRPDQVVMIGNSPASDINNAKRAGLHTIYVPYSNTWEFELEPIMNEEPPTIHAENFSSLAN